MLRFGSSVCGMTRDTITTAPRSIAPAPARGPIVSRALLVRFVSIVGSSIGFYLPLSVVPLFAKQNGPASAAALPTVALLLASVAGELLTPRLLARIGYRCALAPRADAARRAHLVLTVASSVGVIVAVSLRPRRRIRDLRGRRRRFDRHADPARAARGGLRARRARRRDARHARAARRRLGGRTWGYPPVFVVTTVATLLPLLSVPGSAQGDGVRASAATTTAC